MPAQFLKHLPVLLALLGPILAMARSSDSGNNFDLALLESSSLAELELYNLPCHEQVLAQTKQKHANETAPTDGPEAWVNGDFNSDKQDAITRVVTTIGAKYPSLTTDQSQQIRANIEYIILPSPLYACPVAPTPAPPVAPPPVSAPQPSEPSTPPVVVAPAPPATPPTAPPAEPTAPPASPPSVDTPPSTKPANPDLPPQAPTTPPNSVGSANSNGLNPPELQPLNPELDSF